MSVPAVEDFEAIRRRAEELKAEQDMALTGSMVPVQEPKIDQTYSYEDIYG